MLVLLTFRLGCHTEAPDVLVMPLAQLAVTSQSEHVGPYVRWRLFPVGALHLCISRLRKTISCGKMPLWCMKAAAQGIGDANPFSLIRVCGHHFVPHPHACATLGLDTRKDSILSWSRPDVCKVGALELLDNYLNCPIWLIKLCYLHIEYFQRLKKRMGGK